MPKKLITKKSKKQSQVIKVQLSCQQHQSDLQQKNYQIQQQSQLQIQKNKHQNSLTILTKKFIDLIKSRPYYTIDLNDAAFTLNVQKRRIYDIINVLEGVGYVQKIQKNIIRFLGCTGDKQLKDETKYNQIKIQQLIKRQKQLDQQTQAIYEKIKNQFKKDSNLNYIKESQLKQLVLTQFNPFSGALVIQLQEGSTISSSYSTKKDQAEVILFSKNEMIMYLVQKQELLSQNQKQLLCQEVKNYNQMQFNYQQNDQPLKQEIKRQGIFENQRQIDIQKQELNEEYQFFKIEENFDPISNFIKFDNEK